MRIIVTSERRFNSTRDDKTWTSSTGDYSFWERYLSSFDEVVVLARVQPVDQVDPAWLPVTGPKVSVLALPDYIGLSGYVRTFPMIMARLMRVIRPGSAVMLRIPSHVATSVETILRFRRMPYVVEVVGDAEVGMSSEAIQHPLRLLLKQVIINTVRRQCRHACADAYVTARTLQRKYPPAVKAFSTYYSSIYLSDDDIVAEPKYIHGPTVKIICVGSMAKTYKRFDLLIQAVKRCVANGMDLTLTLVGDGESRPYFEDLSRSLGERVSFTGELPGSSAVREELIKADLFVHPSVNEGLPRVVIEAMAVGLPCIATTVGGTPELLSEDDMVPPGDLEALTIKLQKVASSPACMQAMARRNLEVVRGYAHSSLHQRRLAMYKYLKQQTELYNSQNVLP